MAWLITWQNAAVHGHPLKDNPGPICSATWDQGRHLTGDHAAHTFRLLDDDGIVYYEGVSTVAASFAPLDDYGKPNDGCTEIQYRNAAGKWETL